MVNLRISVIPQLDWGIQKMIASAGLLDSRWSLSSAKAEDGNDKSVTEFNWFTILENLS